MSSVNTSGVTIAPILEHISAQLDGTTGIVKIPTSGFDLLGTEGQIAAKSYASSILGYPPAGLVKRERFRDLACRYYSPPLPPGQAPLAAVTPQQPTPPLEPQPPPPAPAPRNRRKKVIRTPDGFTTFRSHHWPFTKQQNPGAKRNDICAILSAKWETMTEEERRPYSQLSGSHSTRRPPSASSEEGPVQTTPDSLEQSQTTGGYRPPSSGNSSVSDLPEPYLPHSEQGSFGQGRNANEENPEDQLADNLSSDALAFLRGEIDWNTSSTPSSNLQTNISTTISAIRLIIHLPLEIREMIWKLHSPGARELRVSGDFD
ncbi:hypothetical protein CIB48_g4381 [Xylaria polymorpha]|nr:hypothetical protein CIB48_g4381 [Xylaria polymorpha]